MARGTCFLAPVSLKKVLKESSPPPVVFSVGICPSGWIPCSRQYSSQHALPIWDPAWPTWIEMHSRCEVNQWALLNLPKNKCLVYLKKTQSFEPLDEPCLTIVSLFSNVDVSERRCRAGDSSVTLLFYKLPAVWGEQWFDLSCNKRAHWWSQDMIVYLTGKGTM